MVQDIHPTVHRRAETVVSVCIDAHRPPQGHMPEQEKGICQSYMRFIKMRLILRRQQQQQQLQNTYRVKTATFPSSKWNVLLFPLGYYTGKQTHTI